MPWKKGSAAETEAPKKEAPPKKETPVKPAVPESVAVKPLKQKSVIRRAAKHQEQVTFAEDLTPMVPQYGEPDPFTTLLMQRQAQARMRAERAAGPYVAMLAAQRNSRVM